MTVHTLNLMQKLTDIANAKQKEILNKLYNNSLENLSRVISVAFAQFGFKKNC